MPAIFLVLLALVLALLAGASAARSVTPKRYFLALGDSITYGMQPTMSKPTPATSQRGYVNVFAARLRKLSSQLEVVNYGCPGESTATFARGGCPAIADGIKLHDAFRGSQLDAAVSFLEAHSGEVSPITLSLYGNDWFPLLLDTCKGDVACVRKRGPKAIAAFESRLRSIVERLRAAAPTAAIIVTGAWNPDPGTLKSLEPTYRSLEASIGRAVTPSRARLARMLPVFNPRVNGKARLCGLTHICSKGDPHPNNAGYRAMADAVTRASG